MKKTLLATVALSVFLAGCNGSEHNTGEQELSSFTELNNRIGELDAAQQGSQATIDEQNRKIDVLTQAQDALAALQKRFDTLQKTYDESPRFDPALLEDVKGDLDALTEYVTDPQPLNSMLSSIEDLRMLVAASATSETVKGLDVKFKALMDGGDNTPCR